MKDFEARSAVAAELSVMGLQETDRLPPAIETAAYRIVQESLTNVARHARAKNAGVLIRCADNLMQLIVEDDGDGFYVDAAQRRNRLGLLGMRERAEMLGGTLAIESAVGSGTTVIASIPLPHDE